MAVFFALFLRLNGWRVVALQAAKDYNSSQRLLAGFPGAASGFVFPCLPWNTGRMNEAPHLIAT